MKVFVILIFLLFSCGKSSEDDVIVYPVIDKKNSMLLLKINTNTDQNLMIEYPGLEEFSYIDEIERSTPEMIYAQKSFEEQEDHDDMAIIKNSSCVRLRDLMNSTSGSIPKFIKKNSEKTYTLHLQDPALPVQIIVIILLNVQRILGRFP